MKTKQNETKLLPRARASTGADLSPSPPPPTAPPHQEPSQIPAHGTKKRSRASTAGGVHRIPPGRARICTARGDPDQITRAGAADQSEKIRTGGERGAGWGRQRTAGNRVPSFFLIFASASDPPVRRTLS
jgi:hypothetical protein